ncbi:MAG: hypothetical protein SF182_03170 [Deltaproteobacteria bacterium]|nr:hypothetical protein [Deltaproteobacteria bacterium]
MEQRNWLLRDLVGFAFLYAQLLSTFWLVPDWSPAHLLQPVYLAAVGGIVTTFAITGIRVSGRRGSVIERLLLAVFLAGMPLIYLSSWLLAPQSGWLAGELLGVAWFVGLAIAGWRGSIWWLAIGIAAHGVGWDLWHYRHATFIPNWYAVGCLLTDLSLGLYVATQAPAFARPSAPHAVPGRPVAARIAGAV